MKLLSTILLAGVLTAAGEELVPADEKGDRHAVYVRHLVAEAEKRALARAAENEATRHAECMARVKESRGIDSEFAPYNHTKCQVIVSEFI